MHGAGNRRCPSSPSRSITRLWSHSAADVFWSACSRPVLSIFACDRGFQRSCISRIDILQTLFGIVLPVRLYFFRRSLFYLRFLHTVNNDAYVFLISSYCLVNVRADMVPYKADVSHTVLPSSASLLSTPPQCPLPLDMISSSELLRSCSVWRGSRGMLARNAYRTLLGPSVSPSWAISSTCLRARSGLPTGSGLKNAVWLGCSHAVRPHLSLYQVPTSYTPT
jgi:hypothetical protein